MNSQPEEDLKQRLKQLEVEINFFDKNSQQVPKKPAQTINFSPERLIVWFNSLSKLKRLAVLGGGLLLGILLLQALFKLVVATFSLAVLGLLVYVGYKFFVSRNFPS